MPELQKSGQSLPSVSVIFERASSCITTHRSLAVSALVTVVVSGLFIIRPDLDVAFSRLFFDGTRFSLADNFYLQRLRVLTNWLGGAILGWTILLLVRPDLRKRLGCRPRDLLLPFAAYGIGAGLLVNGFLKEYFGRARPREVLEFGGDSAFTAAWQLSDACQTNCSFTSGEGAGAMAIFSVMTIVPTLSPMARIAFAILLGCTAIMLGFNRIAFGGHFLSDVLLSMLFVITILLATKVLIEGPLGAAFDNLFGDQHRNDTKAQ